MPYQHFKSQVGWSKVLLILSLGNAHHFEELGFLFSVRLALGVILVIQLRTLLGIPRQLLSHWWSLTLSCILFGTVSCLLQLQILVLLRPQPLRWIGLIPLSLKLLTRSKVALTGPKRLILGLIVWSWMLEVEVKRGLTRQSCTVTHIHSLLITLIWIYQVVTVLSLTVMDVRCLQSWDWRDELVPLRQILMGSPWTQIVSIFSILGLLDRYLTVVRTLIHLWLRDEWLTVQSCSLLFTITTGGLGCVLAHRGVIHGVVRIHGHILGHVVYLSAINESATGDWWILGWVLHLTAMDVLAGSGRQNRLKSLTSGPWSITSASQIGQSVCKCHSGWWARHWIIDSSSLGTPLSIWLLQWWSLEHLIDWLLRVLLQVAQQLLPILFLLGPLDDIKWALCFLQSGKLLSVLSSSFSFLLVSLGTPQTGIWPGPSLALPHLRPHIWYGSIWPSRHIVPLYTPLSLKLTKLTCWELNWMMSYNLTYPFGAWSTSLW